jgi:hypothetical protein
MAIACPNCGTQNADGAQFCQNCRTPLAAAAPVAGAPSMPPPMPPPVAQPVGAMPPPPGYVPGQSAYYTPAGPAAPVHRTPMGLIIGGAMAAFLLIAIIAVAAGFAVSRAAAHSSNPPSSPPTAAPTAAPTQAPTPAPTGKPTAGPTATPTSKPTAAPTPTPAPAAGAITTNTFSLGLADGWKKVKSDKVSALVANGTGSIYVLSGSQDHQSSVDNEFSELVAALKAKYPEVTECTKPADFSIDGEAGTIWGFNYLWTSPSGQAVTVCDLYYFSVPNADPTYFYEVELFMADADFDKFANGEAVPELTTLRWIKK